MPRTHELGAIQGGPKGSPPNPAGKVFDPRYNRLLFSSTWLRFGHQLAHGEFTVEATVGEGETWFDPGYLPVEGSIQSGNIIMASESYPRYAPLTLTMTGCDLRFVSRSSQLVSLDLIKDDESFARFYCTGLWTAAIRYQVSPDFQDGRFGIQRHHRHENGTESSTFLALEILDGSVETPAADLLSGGIVRFGHTHIRRDESGAIRFRMHAARWTWHVADAALAALRIDLQGGPFVNLAIPPTAHAGVSTRVAFLDTLS